MLTTLLERVVQQPNRLDVDEGAAIVRNVRVLGLSSANGRDYLPEAVKAGLRLYEGKGTNVDHPAKPNEPTAVARRCGWLENVQQEADGGLRADWHLLKSHPLTPLILEVASRKPSLLALSHNASGKTRRERGREIVESIEAVHSVDVVVDGATTRGLHEGKSMTVRMTVTELISECNRLGRHGYARGLREQVEAGIMGPETEMDAPSEDPPASESADHEQALKDGFLAAGTAALQAALDGDEEALKKLVEYVKAHRKLAGKSDSGGGGGDSEPKEEGLKLQLRAVTQLASRGITITPVLEMAVAAVKTAADVDRLVESAARSQGFSRPRSAPAIPLRLGKGLQESRPATLTDGAALARYLQD